TRKSRCCSCKALAIRWRRSTNLSRFAKKLGRRATLTGKTFVHSPFDLTLFVKENRETANILRSLLISCVSHRDLSGQATKRKLESLVMTFARTFAGHRILFL